MKMKSIELLVVALTLTHVSAWSYVGHRLVAQIAQQYLTDKTEQKLKKILPEVDGDISKIASWADQIKGQPQYRYTAPLHYVDTHDDPPNSCVLNPVRDCPDGKCVLGAIKDFAQKLAPAIDYGFVRSSPYRRPKTPPHNPPSEPAPQDPSQEISDALKFLVHFIGDVHQPLHVSGKLRGGNQEFVYFEGRKANLHSVWDGKLLDKRIRENFKQDSSQYIQFLNLKAHKEWVDEASKWTQCPQKLKVGNNDVDLCPEVWATYVDKLNCDTVWVFPSDENEDLAGDYYERNIDTLDRAITMGGIRLGHALNEIFDNSGGEAHVLPVAPNAQPKHEFTSQVEPSFTIAKKNPYAISVTTTSQQVSTQVHVLGGTSNKFTASSTPLMGRLNSPFLRIYMSTEQ